jgi:protein TonB
VSRNDYIGLSTSAAVHFLLLLLFLIVSTTPEPLAAGYLEVEFGEFAEGRPVQRALPKPVEKEPEEVQPAETRQQPKPAPTTESKPVDLPDQTISTADPEIRSPEADEIEPDPVEREPDPTTVATVAAAPAASAEGQLEGETGNLNGVEGRGVDTEKAAPYILEGIDRIPLRTQLPHYDEKVNAVIQVRITVDPNGRIVRVLPLRKGNPTLEEAVMQALGQWLFNPLGPGSPRDNQTGTITFRFRLE